VQSLFGTCVAEPFPSWFLGDSSTLEMEPQVTKSATNHLRVVVIWKAAFAGKFNVYYFYVAGNHWLTEIWEVSEIHCFENLCQVSSHFRWLKKTIIRASSKGSIICIGYGINPTIFIAFLLLYCLNLHFEKFISRKYIAEDLSKLNLEAWCYRAYRATVI